MAERVLPMQEGVEVFLDKPRRMSLNLWAGYQAERELEVLLGQPSGSVQLLRDFALQTLSMTQLLVLLTCGLRQHDPSVTVEQVGKIVPLGQLTQVLNTVLTAWDQAMTTDGPAPVVNGEDKTASPPSLIGFPVGAEGGLI